MAQCATRSSPRARAARRHPATEEVTRRAIALAAMARLRRRFQRKHRALRFAQASSPSITPSMDGSPVTGRWPRSSIDLRRPIRLRRPPSARPPYVLAGPRRSSSHRLRTTGRHAHRRSTWARCAAVRRITSASFWAVPGWALGLRLRRQSIRRAHDGLINPEASENADWDGIWEAATSRRDGGWSAEILIPFHTLSFKPGLHEWHFNVQRRVQGLLEVDRWASPLRQYQVTQTSRAGVLEGIPEIDLGVGLSVRPAITTGGGVPAPEANVDGEFQPSLDVTQRLGSNVLASATVNTDFAETEVDTRRTNLTRFPLFFPEKRTFSRGRRYFFVWPRPRSGPAPYFSRRIGLVNAKCRHRRRQDQRPHREHELWRLVAATNDKPGSSKEAVMAVAASSATCGANPGSAASRRSAIIESKGAGWPAVISRMPRPVFAAQKISGRRVGPGHGPR